MKIFQLVLVVLVTTTTILPVADAFSVVDSRRSSLTNVGCMTRLPFVSTRTMSSSSRITTSSSARSNSSRLYMSKEINKQIYKKLKSQEITKENSGDISKVIGLLICPANLSAWIFYAFLYGVYYITK